MKEQEHPALAVAQRNEPTHGAMSVPSLDKSVLRRGIGLLLVTVPAFFFNLALAYFASRILAENSFGIFYSAVTAINILFAPATALNLFYTRVVMQVVADRGAASSSEAGRIVLQIVAVWGAGLSAAGCLAAVLVHTTTLGFSLGVAALVILVTYSSYLAEVGRVTLQTQNRALALGFYSVAWMLLRFLFGIVGLLWLHTVWGGLLGIWLATLATLMLVFHPRLGPSPDSRSERAAIAKAIRQGGTQFGSFLRLASSYLLFLAAAHLDVLIAYLTLDRQSLSIYAASSVLPKGLLIATLPIVQLTFPMLVGERSQNRPVLWLVVRGYLLVLGASVAGAAIIALLRDQVCGGAFGIASCRPDIMVLGLVPIVFFALLRQRISISFAYHREWLPLLLVLPLLAGFLWVAFEEPLTVESLVESFLVFGVGCFVFYLATDLIVSRFVSGRDANPADA